jgi:hypothetical protein
MTGSLIALLLLGLVIAGCWVGWLVWAKRKRDKAEALAEPTLDIIFNGRPLPTTRLPTHRVGSALRRSSGAPRNAAIGSSTRPAPGPSGW